MYMGIVIIIHSQSFHIHIWNTKHILDWILDQMCVCVCGGGVNKSWKDLLNIGGTIWILM